MSETSPSGAAEKHISSNSNPRRSFAKAVSWRIIGSLDTAFWGWLFTGSFKIAGSIATFEVVTKIVLYYFHERAWSFSRFGLRDLKKA
ncbi:DUF2061 domain-containing protein [Aestuariivirga litoralis]|uniref:DUF2061 domain-containing protein n=1 Tax=Aestuariivirga litoralis TaxID=2650924 RepID=UPI0018C7750A|nr:DUF2061 domain-containing protein [Aestuariivirga litoralis]MBG1231592.1 DUF2061 domain-containing protein [Aestuariivirga litoralis]